LVVKKYIGSQRKCRKYYKLPQIAAEGTLIVYNPDITTLERAIKERVFFVQDKVTGEFSPPPKPKKNVYEHRLVKVTKLLRGFLPRATPFSDDEFVACYAGRRQEVYRKAVDSLVVNGIQRKDAHIRVFVKAEKVKAGSAPRCIQPRDPRYNVEVGKFIKPIEKRVYKAIAKLWKSRNTVMKGLNASQVGDNMNQMWGKFKCPVAVGLDASRFDQHCSVPALKWEHEQYVRCFAKSSDRRKLSKLLRWQLTNIGKGYCRDGKLKYKVLGCRMSGDMNTALGNCLIMSALVWAYCDSKGIRAQLANNGDDCVVFMERSCLKSFSSGLAEWFLEMGYTMKVEKPVFELPKVEFCQGHPVYDGKEWVMVRNLTAFVKDSISLFPLTTEGGTRKWMDAVGQGGLALTAGIPIWETYYNWFCRSAGRMRKAKGNLGHKFGISDHGSLETGMMQLAKGMCRESGITDWARYSYWIAFGVLPDYQVAVEQLISSLVPLKFKVNPSNVLTPSLFRV
jgi:hypothetical protein